MIIIINIIVINITGLIAPIHHHVYLILYLCCLSAITMNRGIRIGNYHHHDCSTIIIKTNSCKFIVAIPVRNP